MHTKTVIAGVVVAALAVVLTLPAELFSYPDATGPAAYGRAAGASQDLGTLRSTMQARYGIPSYEDLESPVEEEELQGYMMVAKARALGVTPSELENPASLQATVEEQVDTLMADTFATRETVAFSGGTAADLEEALAKAAGSIVVLEGDVTLDRTVQLPGGTVLDGAGHVVSCALSGPAFTARDTAVVAIRNLTVEGSADYGVAVANVDRFALTNCSISGMAEKAVVLAGKCSGFSIEDCVFTQNQMGGLYVSGDCEQGVVRGCTSSDNGGCSNWMAGMVFTNVCAEDPLDIWAPFPHPADQAPHFPDHEPMYEALSAPHDIVVKGNTVEGNQSSGIYVDGSYRCFLDSNTVVGNDKEGTCLDYGAIACYVHDNRFARNGNRIRQTDYGLELDGMLWAGKLEDGSSKAKLPAVSLDNALYCVVESNDIANNWGGGVKAVRTAVRNTIANNVIVECNEGANDVFEFIGIELGNAEGESGPTMDYLPDLENIVVNNFVSGGHHVGIFLSEQAAGNLVEGNLSEGAYHGDFVNISERENTMQRSFLGTLVAWGHRLLG